MGNIIDQEVEDFKTTLEERQLYRGLRVVCIFVCLILSIIGAWLAKYRQDHIAHCYCSIVNNNNNFAEEQARAWLATNFIRYVAGEMIFYMCTFLGVCCVCKICATICDDNSKTAEEQVSLMAMQTWHSIIIRNLLRAIRWFVSNFSTFSKILDFITLLVK